jgi:hypothetical protein
LNLNLAKTSSSGRKGRHFGQPPAVGPRRLVLRVDAAHVLHFLQAKKITYLSPQKIANSENDEIHKFFEFLRRKKYK